MTLVTAILLAIPPGLAPAGPPSAGNSALVGTTWDAPGGREFSFLEGGQVSISLEGRSRPGRFLETSDGGVEIRALIGAAGASAGIANGRYSARWTSHQAQFRLF